MSVIEVGAGVVAVLGGVLCATAGLAALGPPADDRDAPAPAASARDGPPPEAPTPGVVAPRVRDAPVARVGGGVSVLVVVLGVTGTGMMSNEDTSGFWPGFSVQDRETGPPSGFPVASRGINARSNVEPTSTTAWPG